MSLKKLNLAVATQNFKSNLSMKVLCVEFFTVYYTFNFFNLSYVCSKFETKLAFKLKYLTKALTYNYLYYRLPKQKFKAL